MGIKKLPSHVDKLTILGSTGLYTDENLRVGLFAIFEEIHVLNRKN